MIILNDDTFPQTPRPAVVNPERCDGCAFCVAPCPGKSLEIIRRAKTGERVVRVDVEKCLGCGVCQATCPKEAISIPGLSMDILKGYVYEAIDYDSLLDR